MRMRALIQRARYIFKYWLKPHGRYTSKIRILYEQLSFQSFHLYCRSHYFLSFIFNIIEYSCGQVEFI